MVTEYTFFISPFKFHLCTSKPGLLDPSKAIPIKLHNQGFHTRKSSAQIVAVVMIQLLLSSIVTGKGLLNENFINQVSYTEECSKILLFQYLSSVVIAIDICDSFWLMRRNAHTNRISFVLNGVGQLISHLKNAGWKLPLTYFLRRTIQRLRW